MGRPSRTIAGDPPELIPDTAIRTADEDRLGLDAVAGVVVDLAAHVNTPATIGVFGAWGSGKTSLGHLIRHRLEDPERTIDAKFVYFNAWKYSEAPLRRHFLTKAAQSLGAGKAYSRSLYAHSKTTKYSISGQTAKFIALLTVGIVVAFLLLVAAYQGVVWWVSGQSIDLAHEVASTVTSSAGAILLSTALLAPVLTFLLNQMKVEEDLSEPSSDEQFDDLFGALIDKRVPKGAVALFFIDELDRAPASHMQSVLETFKTFLDHPRCVFVVAADKVVLEQAVAENDDLATPDRASAYYSSGSAYLDKIFEYQVHLPAFENRILTRFALSLVADRGGVWRALGDDREAVVSTLMPSHVRSPRRAKVLLNGYALSVRTARERLGVRLADPDYLELAKLTCIRTEFPLFYRDLEQMPSLAELTTAVILGDEERIAMFGGSSELMQRARAYASRQRAADVELAREDSQTPTGSQLVDYLRRTRNVELRNGALLYMRPPGLDVGLTPEIASDLAIASRDGAFEYAVKLVTGLPADRRIPAILHLTRILEDSVGLEIPNAAATLLAVADKLVDELTPTAAEDVLGAIGRTSVWQLLAADSVPALLQVGTRLSPEGQRALEAKLFARTEEGPDRGVPLIAGFDLFGDESRADSRSLLARYVKEEPVAAMNALSALGSESISELMQGAPAAALSEILADASPPKNPAQKLAERVLSGVRPATQWAILGPVLANGTDVVIERNDSFLSKLDRADSQQQAEAALGAIAKQPTNVTSLLQLLPATRIEADATPVVAALVSCVAFVAEAEDSEPVIAQAGNLGPVIHDNLNFATLEEELEGWVDGSWVGDPDPRVAQHNLLLAVGRAAGSVSPGFGELLVHSLVAALSTSALPTAARDELERLLTKFKDVRPTDLALSALFEAIRDPRPGVASDSFKAPFIEFVAASTLLLMLRPSERQVAALRSILTTDPVTPGGRVSASNAAYIKLATPTLESDPDVVVAAARVYGDQWRARTEAYWRRLSASDTIRLLDLLFEGGDVATEPLADVLRLASNESAWATRYGNRVAVASTRSERAIAWRQLCSLRLQQPRAQKVAIDIALDCMTRSSQSFDDLVRGLETGYPAWTPSRSQRRRLRSARDQHRNRQMSGAGQRALEALLR